MLYLSAKTEYGLNFLIILAKNKKILSLRALARQGKLPYHFIGRIAKDLIAAGLVVAKEGKNGGYTLSRSPARIKFKDILIALDEDFVFARCLGQKKCQTKNCKVKPVWMRVKKIIDRELSQVLLADLF